MSCLSVLTRERFFVPIDHELQVVESRLDGAGALDDVRIEARPTRQAGRFRLLDDALGLLDEGDDGAELDGKVFGRRQVGRSWSGRGLLSCSL